MRRTGPDLVTDEHDVAALEAEALEGSAHLDGVSAWFAPPATAIAFSPASSTTIRATPVGSPGSVMRPRDIDPLGLERGARRGPERVVADGTDEIVSAPSRAAATAWLPPLPP